MRRALGSMVLLPALLGFAQAPGSLDADGNLYFSNGTGRLPLDRKGEWRIQSYGNPTGNGGRVPPVTVAEMKTLQATLDGLSAVFQATPEASRLLGYWMKESRTFDYAKPVDAPPEFAAARLPVSYSTGFYPFLLKDILQKGVYVPQWAGETESVYFWFNRLPGAMGRPVIAEETLPNEYRLQIYLRPRVTEMYKGFPLIERQDLLVTRPGRDPWSPVSYREALRMTMPLLEKDRKTAEDRLTDLKKKNEQTQAPAYEAAMRARLEKYSGEFRTSNPRKWEGRVQGMEREMAYNRERAAKAANPQRDNDGLWYWNPVEAHGLAARTLAGLSTEDAKAEACYVEAKGPAASGRYQMKGTILKTGASECEPLAKDNAAYFDAKLPRTQAQILVVRSIGRCGEVRDGRLVANMVPQPNKPAQGCARHPIYWEQMEWSKVGALVTP
jgi:hypothetical protein